MRYVAITAAGFYARRTVRSTGTVAWDTTRRAEEAHKFRSRRAAERHAQHWPEGWAVREVNDNQPGE